MLKTASFKKPLNLWVGGAGRLDPADPIGLGFGRSFFQGANSRVKLQGGAVKLDWLRSNLDWLRSNLDWWPHLGD